LDDRVASIRLEAAEPRNPLGGWCFWIAESQPDPKGLALRQIADIAVITQDQGDGYDYRDHPTTETPYELLYAIFRPGRALVVGEALGVFKPESMALLKEQAEYLEDALVFAAEEQMHALKLRLMDQAFHFRDWAQLSAKELCRTVDLASQAVSLLKEQPPFGLRSGDANSLWEELLEEAKDRSLLNDGFQLAVDQAVHDAFKALPRATQLAYWLLHSPAADELVPGEDWERPSKGPEAWDLTDLPLALESAARTVWAKADDEAHAKL
jgi:hypothetical protein